jgi:hypothetical protein
VRLADDARARVPFALIGVLLLVGATTYAVTLATRGPARTDRRVDAALERVDVSGSTAVRSAVARAARDASARPVVTPANTSYGRVLNDSQPFRDALRIRIYVALARALRATSYENGPIEAAASLPATPNASALRAAKRRVRLDPNHEGTALDVTVVGIRVTARRDGRVVARQSRTVEATVATPVFALHNRTARYERRLNRRTTEGVGLGLFLAAGVNGFVWTRGQAQHHGLPIENVLATRHVELTTNRGALVLQRATFGRTDPDARVGLRRASARTAVHDATTLTNASGTRWIRDVLPDPNAPSARDRSIPDGPAGGIEDDTDPTNRTMNASAGRTANRTFAEFLHGDATPSLERVVERAYRADARLLVRTDRTTDGSRPPPDPPGSDGNLTLVRETVDSEATVEPARLDRPVPSDGDWRLLRTFDRRVRVVHTVERTWVPTGRTGRTVRTTATWSDTYEVATSVVARPAAPVVAPDGFVHPVFERGGPLDGPNLQGVPGRAWRRLVVDQGGPDGVAAAAARGRLETRRATIEGDRPANVTDWIATDLDGLRRRVANTSVEYSARAAAAGAANPAAELADALASRRERLVDPPRTYDGVAGRARVDARAAYLDLVLRRLRDQAERKRAADGRFGDLLSRWNVSMDDLAASLDATGTPRRPVSPRLDGPAGPVVLVPDAGPAYLSTAAVGDGHLPAIARGSDYRPLVTRNLNVFTYPFGDTAGAVVDAVPTGTETVPLRRAARQLVTFETVSARTSRTDAADEDVEAQLREGVGGSMGVVRADLRGALERETSLNRSAREAAVAAAVRRWEGVGRRALAATNGSLADATADEAIERGATDRDRLRTVLRARLLSARHDSATRVPRPAVTPVSTVVRDALRGEVRTYLERHADRGLEAAEDTWFGKSMGRVPAGLPVLPPVSGWYFTANVWIVEVRGAYARFVVRARVGDGSAVGSSVRYVRENATVRVDVDADGRRELLGVNERIDFRTGTVGAIAVTPTGTGVGDVDGVAAESSPGWPSVGCLDGEECFPYRERVAPNDTTGSASDGAPIAAGNASTLPVGELTTVLPRRMRGPV